MTTNITPLHHTNRDNSKLKKRTGSLKESLNREANKSVDPSRLKNIEKENLGHLVTQPAKEKTIILSKLIGVTPRLRAINTGYMGDGSNNMGDKEPSLPKIITHEELPTIKEGIESPKCIENEIKHEGCSTRKRCLCQHHKAKTDTNLSQLSLRRDISPCISQVHIKEKDISVVNINQERNSISILENNANQYQSLGKELSELKVNRPRKVGNDTIRAKSCKRDIKTLFSNANTPKDPSQQAKNINSKLLDPLSNKLKQLEILIKPGLELKRDAKRSLLEGSENLSQLNITKYLKTPMIKQRNSVLDSDTLVRDAFRVHRRRGSINLDSEQKQYASNNAASEYCSVQNVLTGRTNNNMKNSRINEKNNIRREVQHKRTVSAFLPEIVKKNLDVQEDEKQVDFVQNLEQREPPSRQFQTPNNSIISHSRGTSLDESQRKSLLSERVKPAVNQIKKNGFTFGQNKRLNMSQLPLIEDVNKMLDPVQRLSRAL